MPRPATVGEPGGRPDVLRLVRDGREITRPLPLDPAQTAVFRAWLEIARASGVPYALGGAYVVYAYTGAWRDTKDLDIFVEPRGVKPLLDALDAAGFDTEVRDRLWLAKAHSGENLLDLLFAVRHPTSLQVTTPWFETCSPARFLGVPTCLLGPEELIATKVYVAARDRFDGADIVHIVRSQEGRIDWRRVVDLLGGDEEIVLWHLLLFHYVYPELGDELPTDLLRDLFRRALEGRARPPAGRTRRAPRFRGTLLDPASFGVDRELWGYEDPLAREPLIDAEGEAL